MKRGKPENVDTSKTTEEKDKEKDEYIEDQDSDLLLPNLEFSSDYEDDSVSDDDKEEEIYSPVKVCT